MGLIRHLAVVVAALDGSTGDGPGWLVRPLSRTPVLVSKLTCWNRGIWVEYGPPVVGPVGDLAGGDASGGNRLGVAEDAAHALAGRADDVQLAADLAQPFDDRCKLRVKLPRSRSAASMRSALPASQRRSTALTPAGRARRSRRRLPQAVTGDAGALCVTSQSLGESQRVFGGGAKPQAVERGVLPRG